MLSVLTNFVFGLALVANPGVDPNAGDAADELALSIDPQDEQSVEAPEGTSPRQWECAYGDNRGDYNYCLVQCEGDLGYTEIIGYTVRDTSRNRNACKARARQYCEQFYQRVEDTCWGYFASY
jgi:hypothetical protein